MRPSSAQIIPRIEPNGLVSASTAPMIPSVRAATAKPLPTGLDATTTYGDVGDGVELVGCTGRCVPIGGTSCEPLTQPTTASSTITCTHSPSTAATRTTDRPGMNAARLEPPGEKRGYGSVYDCTPSSDVRWTGGNGPGSRCSPPAMSQASHSTLEGWPPTRAETRRRRTRRHRG